MVHSNMAVNPWKAQRNYSLTGVKTKVAVMFSSHTPISEHKSNPWLVPASIVIVRARFPFNDITLFEGVRGQSQPQGRSGPSSRLKRKQVMKAEKW